MTKALSGLLLTHNSERTIEKCIESFKNIVDEIIIVDDHSTDQTLAIIKKVAPEAKVVTRQLNHDFASQRNYALSLVKNEWVLFIDSDECLTPSLAKQIQQTLQRPAFDAYISRRDNQVLNMFFPNTSGRPILLKKHLKFHGRLHENVKEKTGFLKEALIHYSWTNSDRWIDDMNRYSYMSANKWIQEKRKYNRFHLFLIGVVLPPLWFIKLYLLDGRFRGGFVLLPYCFGCAVEWTFTAVKFYEMKYTNNYKDAEKIR